jgi:5-methylcytosine-specific restriction protein A
MVTKHPKIASGTTARSVPEWIGKTPDTEAPMLVKLRILLRQGGRCAITGHEFHPGDKRHLDHIIPRIDGGQNRESNLQWILDEPHKAKTSAEAKTRSKTRRQAATHAGIKPPPKRPLQSRGFPKAGKTRSDRIPLPGTPTALSRQFKDEK